MKVIIAGSRDLTDAAEVAQAMERAAARGIVPTMIVSGTARGVDRLGEAWAEARGIPVARFPADWDRWGRRLAGRRRNAEMAEYADALVAVWDGASRGTENMIRTAHAKGLQVYVWLAKGAAE